MIFSLAVYVTAACAGANEIRGEDNNQNHFMRKNVITSDGVNISWLWHNMGHKRVIVIAHGFYNSKEAVLLKQLGQDLSNEYDVALIDFRGHGKSGDLFYWTSKEYLDLTAVLEELSRSYDTIGVVGFSLGAATTIITASKTDLINSMVLVSPPTKFEKIEYRLWEIDFNLDIKYSLFGEGRIGKGVRPGPWWLAKEQPIDCMAQIKQPMYFIHGTKDWLIKPWHTEALYNASQSSKKMMDIIPNGPHAEYLMLTHREIIVEKIRKWFRGTLS